MVIRLLSVLDVASRACNEVKGRCAKMWTRSSGGQSNKLAMAAPERERRRSTIVGWEIHTMMRKQKVKRNRWTIGCSKS